MTVAQLLQHALVSGQFPTVAARRLRNVITECFAPRYLVQQGAPARHLKILLPHLNATELHQLLLLHTCRANAILADFIRQVYWQRYAAGYSEIDNHDARRFVESAVDRGKMSKRWSDGTIRRVSAYLTGCCADYGLLEHSQKTPRKILPYRLAAKTAAYLAYDLHFHGLGDAAVFEHPDWGLFGLNHFEALDEIKRLALQGLLIVQAAGGLVQINWKHPTMETLCNVINQR